MNFGSSTTGMQHGARSEAHELQPSSKRARTAEPEHDDQSLHQAAQETSPACNAHEQPLLLSLPALHPPVACRTRQLMLRIAAFLRG